MRNDFVYAVGHFNIVVKVNVHERRTTSSIVALVGKDLDGHNCHTRPFQHVVRALTRQETITATIYASTTHWTHSLSRKSVEPLTAAF